MRPNITPPTSFLKNQKARPLIYEIKRYGYGVAAKEILKKMYSNLQNQKRIKEIQWTHNDWGSHESLCIISNVLSWEGLLIHGRG